MYVTVNSILMTVLWFTLTVGLGCLMLAKSKKYQVELIDMLLLFSLLRLFLPLSPEGGVIIDSKYVYPAVLAWVRSPLLGQLTRGGCLLLLWGTVALVRLALLIGRLVKQNRFWNCVPGPSAGSELPKMALAVAQSLGYCGIIEVTVSPTSVTAYQVGFFRPRILLPHNVETLPRETTDSILRHELSHFLGGDLWIKLGVQFLSCVLWWNPVMPFLNQCVEQLLELRCDHRACRDLTDEARLSYANALLQVIQNNPPARQKVSLGFLGASEDARIVQRFQMVLSRKPLSVSKARLLVAFAVCAVLFVASYYVELQPHTTPPIEGIEEGVVFSSETAYIIHTADSSFELYYEGKYVDKLPEQALMASPYRDLKIYEGDVGK